eukprot:3901125-Rhodomonas_salina.1
MWPQMQRASNPLTTTTCNKCNVIQQEIDSNQNWIEHYMERSIQNDPLAAEELNQHLISVSLLQKQLAVVREEARAKAAASAARATSN